MRMLLSLALIAASGCTLPHRDAPGDPGAVPQVGMQIPGGMGSAMYIDETGSYFLGGYGLPEGYALGLPAGVVDLSDADPADWPD